MMVARSRVRRWLAAIGLGVLLVLPMASALAAEDPFNPAAPKGPSEKDYVLAYFITGFLMGIGIFVACRPMRRSPEIPQEHVISGAEKDTRNY